MNKQILLIHGRHYKPAKNDLQKLWLEALRYGIERDFPEKLEAFKDAKIDFVYYGDISNDYLSKIYDEKIPDDLQDRRDSLEDLKQYSKSQYTKTTYKKLPGYNPWMEAAADIFAGGLKLIGLSDEIIEQVAPDMHEYWRSLRFGSDVRMTFTDAIIKAMKRDGDICVIAHSLGTMISYDVFWKLCYYSEYRYQSWNRKVNLWVTLGSPLADETVKANLKGAREREEDRFPRNVERWINIAAEDDYIAHDQKVSGDYRAMKRLGYVNYIQDKRIYNLALRDGESNPHNGVGYLIHPTTAESCGILALNVCLAVRRTLCRRTESL